MYPLIPKSIVNDVAICSEAEIFYINIIKLIVNKMIKITDKIDSRKINQVLECVRK